MREGFSVMLSCSGVMRHTWKLGHQRVSTVCVRSTPGTTCMSCAYKHGETVTHCMLSSSRLSCLPGKTARCLSLCLCLSPHIPLSSAFALQYGLFTTEFSHSWRQLVSFYNPPPSTSDTITAFSPFGAIMTAELNLQPPVCLGSPRQSLQMIRRSSAAVGLQGCIIHSGSIRISLPTL